jgi:Flp pilus assembly CpaF family ATPase
MEHIVKQKNSLELQWVTAGNGLSLSLAFGKYYLGSSPFCHVRVDQSGKGIAAEVDVNLAGSHLRPHSGSVRLNGAMLKVGEVSSLSFGDKILIGRTEILCAIERKFNGSKPSSCPLIRKDRLRKTLFDKVLENLQGTQLVLNDFDTGYATDVVWQKLKKLAPIILEGIPTEEAASIEQDTFNEIIGLGPLEAFIADDSISEIMVNSRSQIFVEKSGKLMQVEQNFSSDAALLHVIERIVSNAGRRIDVASPIADARLTDGSRVNAIIPPLAIKGPSLTIRKFPRTNITGEHLVEWGALPGWLLDKLKDAVIHKSNMLITGGTSSGKTTLLNALSKYIPATERIITIEDAAELRMQQPHVVSLETKPASVEGAGAIPIRDLVKASLRMRPDRIVVGECRGGEAFDMLQAMNTGHEGSMTTLHANNASDALSRLECLCLMAGLNLPLFAIKHQIASALSLVVHQSRQHNGRRIITEVLSINGYNRDSDTYDTASIYTADVTG